MDIVITEPELTHTRVWDMIRQCRELRAEIGRSMKAARLLVRVSRYHRIRTKTVRSRYPHRDVVVG
jgi:hypothetical protein